MKIVQAVGWYLPESVGGTEIYVSSLSRALRAAGHDVRIAAPEAGLAAPRTYGYDGFEVFRYPIPAAPTRLEAQGDVLVRGAGHFHRWLSSARADVVHMHTFVTGLGLQEIRAARDAGSRVFVTTHASSLGFICQRGTLMLHGKSLCDGRVELSRCAECALEHSGAPPIVSSMMSALPASVSRVAGRLPGSLGTALGMTDLIERNVERQRRMFEAVDAFIVLTDYAAQIARANGAPAGKVVVNRAGVREGVAAGAGVSPRPANTPITVGYVGRFEHVKGVIDLARAMRRVPADVDIRVEFRGPAVSEGDLVTKALVSTTCAGDRRVAIQGGVDPKDIVQLLNSYDVICCPSRCLEGGPMVALEAMAVGVPVIAASIGGAAEVLQDGVNARLVPPGDVDRLAAALVEVARNPQATICEWRKHLPATRTMNDVTRDYLALYSRN
jgi:glycosyltransferase involved in cell wall biosynthesis